MIRVYLAGRYSRRGEFCDYADQLRELGFIVVSRWLRGDHELGADGLSVQAADAERARFAEEDWSDVTSADWVISFTEEPRSSNSRGGRHVEFGAALALQRRCIVIGPRENVFHHLSSRLERFTDWEAFIELTKHQLDRGHWPIEDDEDGIDRFDIDGPDLYTLDAGAIP